MKLYKTLPLLIILLLLGCNPTSPETISTNPSPSSEPSQAVKEAFGGKLFYQRSTPEEISKCKSLGDNCALIKVDKTYFCGMDALVFLHFSQSTYVSDCVGGVPQELSDHYEQTPTIDYVFYGDLQKGETPTLIDGQTFYISTPEGEPALVGLIKDDKGRWFIAKTELLGVNKKAPERPPHPQDAPHAFIYDEIPTEPQEMKDYFREAFEHPEQLCTEKSPEEFRNNLLQRYKNASTATTC